MFSLRVLMCFGRILLFRLGVLVFRIVCFVGFSSFLVVLFHDVVAAAGVAVAVVVLHL